MAMRRWILCSLLLGCTEPETPAMDAGDASAEADSVSPPKNPPPVVTPPMVSCADAASSCAMPPSVCADSSWLAYFDDGACVDGQCHLVTKYYFCETGCSKGACIHSCPTANPNGCGRF